MTVPSTRIKSLKSTVRQVLGRPIASLNRWTNPLPYASFLQYYETERRIYQNALTLTGRQWGELWAWETKQGGRALAHKEGLRVPEVFSEGFSIAELDFSDLPDQFVLKPDRGYGRSGVFVLQRTGNTYVDLLSGETQLSERPIKEKLLSLDANGLISGENLQIEQALLTDGKLPFEWKVYSFQGETPLVLQISREKTKNVCVYDEAWQKQNPYDLYGRILGRRHRAFRSYADLPSPQQPQEILELASRVSKLIPVPFARIDLYEFEGNVHLGEITPMPGGRQRFAEPVDVQLGLAWQRAESRLLAQSSESS